MVERVPRPVEGEFLPCRKIVMSRDHEMAIGPDVRHALEDGSGLRWFVPAQCGIDNVAQEQEIPEMYVGRVRDCLSFFCSLEALFRSA